MTSRKNPHGIYISTTALVCAASLLSVCVCIGVCIGPGAGVARADTIYKPGPGSLQVDAASGMSPLKPETWDFTATNFDPYTKPIKFPKPIPTENVKAIAIELEKNNPAPGERMELFPVLDNGKGVTSAQHLTVPLEKGRRRYVFGTEGIRWFKGKLTALRLDPGAAPGEVSIKSIARLEPRGGAGGARGG
ncbi:MAG: hypothetical protein LBK99_03005, partial [Opitutaceae bacterium]|nr:hypothetical protein [Opitutaceae bacterium]